MVNKVFLVGNIGRDPIIRFTQNKKKVANVSIATSKVINDQKITQWHNIVAWGYGAELLEKTTKGDKIFVEGSIEYRKKELKNEMVTFTNINADRIEIFANKEQVNPHPTDLMDHFDPNEEILF